jgi:hypothetical protein
VGYPQPPRLQPYSRWWRHAVVHTLSFLESRRRTVPDDDDDYEDDESDWSSSTGSAESSSSGSYKDPAPAAPRRVLADAVNAELHGRHRGSRVVAVPLRGLRIEFYGRDGTAPPPRPHRRWTVDLLRRALGR